MKFQKTMAILFCVTLMISVTACSKNEQINGSISSRTQSSSSLVSQGASSSASTSASSKPISSASNSVSSATKNSASKSISSVKQVTSKNSSKKSKSLVFAEDDNTKAIFHIGMTADQVKQALTENQMQTVKNEYPSSSRISTDNGIDLLFVLGTDLLGMISIDSVSDTQLHSPYETQKGLKIGDTVKTVRKLYGEPVEQEKYGDDINGLGVAYYYDTSINLDDYYKKQTVKNKSDRGVYLRINISQSKGNNFNKVVNIIYADKANN